jgi:hypothetical protein
MIINYLKTHIRGPSPAELMQTELQRAQIELLDAETAVEYAHSIVAYNKARIERLTNKLKGKQ